MAPQVVMEGPPGQGATESRWSRVSPLRVRPGWPASGWARGETEGLRAPFTCVRQEQATFMSHSRQQIWILGCLIPFDLGRSGQRSLRPQKTE